MSPGHRVMQASCCRTETRAQERLSLRAGALPFSGSEGRGRLEKWQIIEPPHAHFPAKVKQGDALPSHFSSFLKQVLFTVSIEP